jgi:hypothetical protein
MSVHLPDGRPTPARLPLPRPQINYLVLVWCVGVMFYNTEAALISITAVNSVIFPGLFADADLLRRGPRAAGLVIASLMLIFLQIASLRRLFVGAARYDVSPSPAPPPPSPLASPQSPRCSDCSTPPPDPRPAHQEHTIPSPNLHSDAQVSLFMGFTTARACALNRAGTIALFMIKNLYRQLKQRENFTVLRTRVAKAQVRHGAGMGRLGVARPVVLGQAEVPVARR